MTDFMMPASEYYEIQALSNSGMKDLAISPLRYWHRWINPEREPHETPAMRLGTALHHAVLQRETFLFRYARAIDPADWPVCLNTSADIREWIASKGEKPKGTRKDDLVGQALMLMERNGDHVPIFAEKERRFCAENEGKVILTPAEWLRIEGMAKAFAGEPALQQLLSDGEAEVSMQHRDAETGVRLKARMDWVAPGVIVDLKTFSQKNGKTIDESVHDAIYYERYFHQAAFYTMLRSLLTGEKVRESRFVFAFVESDPPYETRIKVLRPIIGGQVPMYWQMADRSIKRAIRLYANCSLEFGDKPWRTDQDAQLLDDCDIPQLAYSR